MTLSDALWILFFAICVYGAMTVGRRRTQIRNPPPQPPYLRPKIVKRR